MNLPLEWAFGGGDQAVTFVTRVDEDWYLEHYLTYYSAPRALGPTPGQEGLVADSLPHAVGLLYKTLDPNTGVMGCFQCHSTGPVGIGAKRELQPAELGVRCEACHGPGSLHRDAAVLGQKETARKLIGNPRRMSAAELNQFCGTCHRRPAPPGSATDWNVAWNVRHQPVYLNQAACFRKSNGALSCLTCHDPHQDLRRNDVAYYNQKCLSCHGASRPPQPVCVATKPANCIGCHMPQVSPQAYLRFTNHWIGVYAQGSGLKPIR
ncbi:MAG: multiheme c-type cytochrome [Acidobacteriota bacterium]